MFSVSFILAFVSRFFFIIPPSTSPEADRLQLRFPVHCSHWVPAQKYKWNSRFYTLRCRRCHEYELLLVPSLSVLLQTFLCKKKEKKKDVHWNYVQFAYLMLSWKHNKIPKKINPSQTLLWDYLLSKPMIQKAQTFRTEERNTSHSAGKQWGPPERCNSQWKDLNTDPVHTDG